MHFCVVAVTDHFADAFVRENVARVYMTLWRRNDVRKFDADAILLKEINVKATFTARFMLKSGKICKKNDHTCLFHCINTCRVPRTMFEHSAKGPRVQTASSGPGQC